MIAPPPHIIHVRPQATIILPAGARKITLLDGRVKLRATDDAAPDTCRKQTAFVNRRGTTEAELVRCWNNELSNWTRHTLTVRYTI